MNRLISVNMDKIKALCTAHNVRSLFAFLKTNERNPIKRYLRAPVVVAHAIKAYL